MKKAVLVILALLCAAPAHAQEAGGDVRIVREHDLQLTASEQEELNRWTEDVGKYQAWYRRYRNRISRNFFGFVSDRRELPAVPPWLPAKCDLLGAFIPPPEGPLTAACHLLTAYRADFTVDPAAQLALQTQRQNEQDPHSSFWKHVHLDAAWGSLDYRMQTYGVVGMHVTLPELAKRVQFFLPPGFLLLSVPDGHGGREFQPAATIGVSIRLFPFEFPQNKSGTAYFNLAKAYFLNRQAAAGMKSEVDLVGLSFAWGR